MSDKPTKRPRRPKRSELTTATAQAERREQVPREYNLLDGVAPLAPLATDATARFAHDSFVEQRRFRRANPQGDTERRFDPEQFAATDAYRRRLQSQALDHYTNTDPLIDEEREAAYVEQPPEAIAQFRVDLVNEDFVAKLASRRLASSNNTSALTRRRQLDAQRQRIAAQSALAFEAPLRRPDTLWDIASSNTTSTLTVDERGADNTTMAVDRQIEYDRALLREIDNELNEIDDMDDDDDDAEDLRTGQLRRTLQEERDQVQQRLDEYEQQRAGNDDDEDEDDDEDDRMEQSVHAEDNGGEKEDGAEEDKGQNTEALINLPMIGELEARDLLTVNALHMLDNDLRGPFMQLSEPAMIWQLLNAHVLQHEQHKRHVHLIELVRAMALKGAKYGGLAHVASAQRLGSLVDADFFGSFLDERGRLTGGHEHFVDGTTRFVVLKFYCVRRNKDNSGVIDGKRYAESGATTGASTDKQMHRLLERTDIDELANAGNEHIRLNRAGLYDAHNRIDDAEDDGTDEYSSLHDIKYLEREFMFCVRLVCVEAADVGYGEPLAEYVSDEERDEGDTIALPPELADAASRSPTVGSSATSLLSSTAATRSSATGLLSSSSSQLSTHSHTSSSLLSGLDDLASGAADHSDDDQEEAEHDLEQHRQMAATADYMPGERINITIDQGRHVVGRWHAGRFIQHVNGHQIGPLCVRAFLFYANDSQRKQ
jgi:hypothetical protein